MPPPLAFPITIFHSGSAASEQRNLAKSLKEGCYLLELLVHDGADPASRLSGTLRIERLDDEQSAQEITSFRMSADLYSAPAASFEEIPIFPRSQFHSYWTPMPDTDPDEFGPAIFFSGSGDTLRLNVWLLGASLGGDQWKNSGVLQMSLGRQQQSPVPKFNLELNTGSSTFASGTATQTSSDFFRRMRIRFAKTEDVDAPLATPDGDTWQELFKKWKWLVTASAPTAITHPEGRRVWELGELHSVLAQLDLSESALDTEWLVGLLCVDEIFAFGKHQRGIMFDFGQAGHPDTNGVPRQASAVAAGWKIPISNPDWKAEERTRFDQFPNLYFRTALHEVGHALNMEHHDSPDVADAMATTADLVGRTGFPDRMPIGLSERERTWICHQPDPVVRPGGLPYPFEGEVTDDEAVGKLPTTDKVRLTVAAWFNPVPLGAPVRLGLTLTNSGRQTVSVPKQLELCSDQMGVAIRNPRQEFRRVAKSVLCWDDEAWKELAPGKSQKGAITLFSDPQGSLFRQVGDYRVQVRALVRRSKRLYAVTGEKTVTVQAPETPQARDLAERVLRSKAIRRMLAWQAEYDGRSSKLVSSLLNDKSLAQHFRVFEAQRVGTCYFKRCRNLRRMASLFAEGTLMTYPELDQTVDLISHAMSEGCRAYASIARIQGLLGGDSGLVQVKGAPQREVTRRVNQLSFCSGGR